MGRYLGPVCKLCRREGDKLYLKGQRCFSPKCAVEKREGGPGQHGKGGSRGGRGERISDYAKQLRAKQKARRVYGMMERPFRRFFGMAQRSSGITGTNLLQTLELRLDNVVFRMGYAENRSQARQMVNHGHFNVNGSRNDVPSMLLKPGDQIAVREASKAHTYYKELPDYSEKRSCASWLDRDVKSLTGRVLRTPERSEIDGNLNEQLIVEYYSR
jgi:small subunit ribosomal protein S4